MGIFLLSTLRCSLKTLPPRFLHHLLTLISVGIFFYADHLLDSQQENDTTTRPDCVPIKSLKTTKATEIQWLFFIAVEQGYKLSNKFIEDLQKIHDYIEHFHVNLTR